MCACGQEVVPYGQPCSCAQERKAAHDAARPSASARGYDAAWRKSRAAYLEQHPHCSTIGCERPATEVDHIKSIREAPHLRLKWSNFRAFCKPCHSRRTARDQAFGRTPPVSTDS